MRTRVAHEGDRVDRPEPTLVRIESRHLHERRPIAERLAERTRFGRGERLEPALGDAVRQHRRVDVGDRHLGAHEARDRGDGGGAAQKRKVDAAESVSVVRVPKDGGSAGEPNIQDRGCADGGIGRLPVLEEQDGAPSLRGRRGDEVRDVRGNGPREIAPLAILAVVHVARVMSTDPLGPALEDEAAVGALLTRRHGRVADEQVMNEVATIDQRVGQVDHACREAADERIAVGTFEGDKHHVVHRRARIMARAR